MRTTMIELTSRVIACFVAVGASFWAAIGLPFFILILFSPSAWEESWSNVLSLICGYSAIVGLFWRAIVRSPSKLPSVLIWLLSLTANVWAMVATHSFYPTHWDPWDIWLAACWLDIAAFLSLLGFVLELISRNMLVRCISPEKTTEAH